MNFKFIIALATTCLLIGHEALATEQSDPNQKEPIPQSIWQPNADGGALHVQSGLSCPPTVKTYRLQSHAVHDRFGFDVSCNYWNQAGDAVTIYLWRRTGETLDADLKRSRNELETAHPDSDLIPNSPSMPILARVPWLEAHYVQKDLMYDSGIWMTDLAGWTLFFRATYPTTRKSEAIAAMAVLAESVVSEVLPHLTNCAIAPEPGGNGKEITDVTLLMATVLTSAGLANIGKMQTETPLWCATTGSEIDGVPILIWQNAASSAASPLLATVTSLEKSPSFELTSNPLVTAVVGGAHKEFKGPIYMLTVVGEKDVRLYAVFDGRPSYQELGQIVANVLLGKKNPFASYDAGGKHVTINTGTSK